MVGLGSCKASRFSTARLDFVALPLFVYGLVALLVTQRQLISGLLSSVTYVVGGKLRSLSLKHMSLKPHRIASFLLIVGLMASVSLYPSIASKSFEDKALRGATVQVGSELHVAINPSDLVSAEQQEQGLGGQVQAIQAVLKERLAKFQHPDVTAVEYLFEAILPGFFFPGYGLSGVPLYLIDDPQRYLKNAIFEEKLGVTGKFSDVIGELKAETIVASPPVAAFWNLSAGEPVLLGADLNKKPVLIPASGIVGFLPGMPPRSISDRQSYVAARIDYLKYLASSDAYLVGTANNKRIENLKVLIPRILSAGADQAQRESARGGEVSAANPQSAAPRSARAWARAKKSRRRHVYLSGAGKHAHLSDRRRALGADRDTCDCADELPRRPPHTRVVARARRIANAAVSIFRVESIGAGAARPGRRLARCARGGLRLDQS